METAVNTLKFIYPKYLGGPVIVNRIMPDNSIEQIGQILQMDDGEGNLEYYCIDRNHKSLFTPTTDYIEAETRFEKYVKELNSKIRAVTINKYQTRMESLKLIRANITNAKGIEIIK